MNTARIKTGTYGTVTNSMVSVVIARVIRHCHACVFAVMLIARLGVRLQVKAVIHVLKVMMKKLIKRNSGMKMEKMWKEWKKREEENRKINKKNIKKEKEEEKKG